MFLRTSLLLSLVFLLNGRNARGAHYDVDDTSKSVWKGPILSVGGGAIYSSLNFFKNAAAYTNYWGSDLRLLCQLNKNVRFATHYSTVQGVNLVPTWYNVTTKYYNIDFHLLTHFSNEVSVFYMLLGIWGQRWSGFYTGLEDFSSLAMKGIPHFSNYTTLYFGAALGCGLEFQITNRVHFFAELKMCFSKTDAGTGLNDVIYGGGFRYDFYVSAKHKRKRGLLPKFNKKYTWF